MSDVGEYHRALRRRPHRDLEVPRTCERYNEDSQLAQQAADVREPDVLWLRHRLRTPGGMQGLLEQPQQMLRRALDLLGVAAARLGNGLRNARVEKVGVAHDDVQRGARLARECGEELAPGRFGGDRVDGEGDAVRNIFRNP